MLVGMIAEKQFLVDAMMRSLLVSVPAHDHNGYDVIIESKTKKLYKVQIKCVKNSDTSKRSGYSFKVMISRGTKSKSKYHKNEVDFFAIYLLELKQWYLIPFAVVCGSTTLRLHPNKKDHRFSSFLEAWHLLK